MGGKSVINLFILVSYIMIANSYVILSIPEKSSQPHNDNNENAVSEGDSPQIIIDSWYNRYNLESDAICGTTDKEYIFLENTQSCYKVHTERATWYDAEETCVREGGHLAVINSRSEAQILAEKFPSGFHVVHVGFSWIDDTWITVNGIPLAVAGYVNWAEKGENVEITRDSFCGSMNQDGSFNGITCSVVTAFICKKNATLVVQPPRADIDISVEVQTQYDNIDTVTQRTTDEAPTNTEGSSEATTVEIPNESNECDPTDPEYIFYANTQSWYKAHMRAATWNDAEATCIAEGGHLAVINSQGEADFITTHFPVYQVFLGFYRKKGTWVTVHGQKLSQTGYENWYYTQPDNEFGVEYCGAMYHDGTFNDISCKYELYFVCEKNPHPAIVSGTQTGSDITETDSESNEEEIMTSDKLPSECSTTDEEYIFNDKLQSSYKIYIERMTWNDAQVTCIRDGGQLAVINSQNEANYLISRFPSCSRQILLGVYRDGDSWMTTHGQTLIEAGYEIWQDGEPNNENGMENCGAMRRDGTFNDIPCDYEVYFVCEKNFNDQPPFPTTETQNYETTENDAGLGESYTPQPTAVETRNECGITDTGYTYYSSTESCYKVHKERVQWDTAKNTCADEGGHLVVINSEEEAGILTDIYPDHAGHVFIGFSYHKNDSLNTRYPFCRRSDGVWLTVDGQTLVEAGYENWTPGEPNNFSGKQYCGTLYTNGKFNDEDCTNNYPFICEIRSSFLFEPLA